MDNEHNVFKSVGRNTIYSHLENARSVVATIQPSDFSVTAHARIKRYYLEGTRTHGDGSDLFDLLPKGRDLSFVQIASWHGATPGEKRRAIRPRRLYFHKLPQTVWMKFRDLAPAEITRYKMFASPNLPTPMPFQSVDTVCTEQIFQLSGVLRLPEVRNMVKKFVMTPSRLEAGKEAYAAFLAIKTITLQYDK